MRARRCSRRSSRHSRARWASTWRRSMCKCMGEWASSRRPAPRSTSATSRIISIYEGTNGIQAIDLVMRKVKRDGGTAAKSELDLFRRIREELDSLGASSLGDMSTNLSDAIDALDQATDWVLADGRSADQLLAVATPYLRLFGLTAAGAYLAKGVTAALREAGAPPDFVPACRFYAEHLLIAAPALARTVMRGAGAVLEQA